MANPDTNAALGEKPTPPKGGSAVKPPAAAAPAFDSASLKQALDQLSALAHAAIRQRSETIADAAALRDQQRADRAHLTAALITVFSEKQPTPEQPHPVEGLYLGEVDILTAYRVGLLNAGILLLPNVVQHIPPDRDGNTHLVVEYNIVDREGRQWPAAVRVAATGNDKGRSGTGDKGAARAMTAAWKEAICRLAFLTTGFEIETQDYAHAAPSPASRPSQQREQKPSLTLKEEDAFRERVLGTLANLNSAAEVDKLMGRDDVKAKLALVSKKSRDAIEGEAAECKRRLNPEQGERRQERRDDRRAGSRREAEGRQSMHDDEGGGAPYDGDDDIPF